MWWLWKTPNLLFLLALLTTIFTIICATTLIEQKKFQKIKNQRRTDSMVHAGQVTKLTTCGKICAQRETCFSYNVVTDANGNKQCEINSAVAEKELVADNTAAYYEVSWFGTDTSIYQLLPKTTGTSDEAEAYCMEQGWHRLRLETQEEYDFILNVITNNYEYDNPRDDVAGYYCYHTDLHLMPDGSWQWGDGTLLAYHRWLPNQPNQQEDFNAILHLRAGGGQFTGWNDSNDNMLCAIACEKNLV